MMQRTFVSRKIINIALSMVLTCVLLPTSAFAGGSIPIA